MQIYAYNARKYVWWPADSLAAIKG